MTRDDSAERPLFDRVRRARLAQKAKVDLACLDSWDGPSHWAVRLTQRTHAQGFTCLASSRPSPFQGM